VTDPEEIAGRNFYTDLKFTTSRSSGPGGQHVNKLETRVTLRFNVVQSTVLTDEEKQHLLLKWVDKLSQEADLIISSQEHKSQLRNKEACLTKFLKLIKAAFTKPKPRRATKPTKGSVRRRKEDKKKHSQKKNLRKPPGMD